MKSKMKKCPNCKATFRASETACYYCGKQLESLSPSGAVHCYPSSDAEGTDRRYSALVRVSRMSNEEITRSIDATHPETLDTSRSLAADQLAMMLIHNRHEKREIVNLLRWLILGAPSPENDQCPDAGATE